jgi:membrane dipeptidase
LPGFTFDAHLDLAMNAMEWNRDLTRPILEIRQREQGLGDKPDRGRGTVCFPEMRRGGIGLCVATQIARYVKPANPLPGWHSPAQAWAHTQGQLAWYRAMEEAGHLVRITGRASLDEHLRLWQAWIHPQPEPIEAAARNTPASGLPQPPLGYVLSLEGADSLASLQHLERAYAQGLRAIGPAHYGPGTYAQGTNASGGLGPEGRQLLKEMQRLAVILDVAHLCDDSFWEAMDLFTGPVWASHANCRALVPHPRQLSDEQIKCLIQRGAVIGLALDAWMLVPGWVRGQTTPQAAGLTLERLADHIDHICQIAGNALHVGIGSDLDGGFGQEQTPADLDTIADLARLRGILQARGYCDEDLDHIQHGNFIRRLRQAWPAPPLR